MKPRKPSNAPSMSSSESDSESSSSSAEVSDTHKSGKREFQYPVPVVLSESEDDAVSPSQHKLAMAKEIADKSVVPNSSSGGEEEEENDDEEDLEQSLDVQSIAPAAITSTDAMFSKFTEMTCHFAEMMEQHWKEQLMAKKKTAQSALSFDSPPQPKSRKLPIRFMPERNAAEIVSASAAPPKRMRILNVIPLRHSHREQQLAYAFRRNLFLLRPSSRMNPHLHNSQSAFARLRQTPWTKISTLRINRLVGSKETM